jgi:hypothetical protein
MIQLLDCICLVILLILFFFKRVHKCGSICILASAGKGLFEAES